MLPHSLTGGLREVDVTISSYIAGHAVIVSIEATATRRRADVEWVEQLVSKHEHLPTSVLILVASGGFTSQARKFALAKGAVPLEVLDAVSTEEQVLDGLETLWAQSYEMTPDAVTLVIASPGGGMTEVTSPPDDFDVVKADGTLLCTLQECVGGLLMTCTNRADHAMSMRHVTADSEWRFAYDFDAPTAQVNDGDDVRLYLRWQSSNDAHEAHLIDRMRVEGRLAVDVRQVSVKHLRLGDASVSFGEAEVVGNPAVLFVTGSPAGPVATMRVRKPGAAEAVDHRLKWLQVNQVDEDAAPLQDDRG